MWVYIGLLLAAVILIVFAIVGISFLVALLLASGICFLFAYVEYRIQKRALDRALTQHYERMRPNG